MMLEVYAGIYFSQLPPHVSGAEHMVRWMYYATRTVPAAYVKLMTDPSLSISSGDNKKFLERITCQEYLEERKRLEQECIAVAQQVVLEDMKRVFSRNCQ